MQLSAWRRRTGGLYDAARSDHAQLREADAASDAERDRRLARVARKRAQTGFLRAPSRWGRTMSDPQNGIFGLVPSAAECCLILL